MEKAGEGHDDAVDIAGGAGDGAFGHETKVAVGLFGVFSVKEVVNDIAEFLTLLDHGHHFGWGDDAGGGADAFDALLINDNSPAAVKPVVVDLLDAAFEADTVVGLGLFENLFGSADGALDAFLVGHWLGGDAGVNIDTIYVPSLFRPDFLKG